jgi:3-deoxy-manno-octulosonate cytidylyltransferase (CMP-KDO synthetase)
MKLAIGIPARYASTRFPGKPLAMIQGLSMLERVYRTAKIAAAGYDEIEIFITTEDKRIAQHAEDIGAICIHTPPSSPTGSDRVLSALRQLDNWPDFIVNLQGDAPFTPPEVIRKILDTYIANPWLEVVTPVHALSWTDLDRLREAKKTTPFSGTTAILNAEGRALWFSKSILPAIRKESEERAKSPISPVYQHIGLYGFRSDILEKFCSLDQGIYENLEGLEQLRMIENGIHVQAVPMDISEGMIQSGIDSPEDIERAQNFLKTFGDPHK